MDYRLGGGGRPPRTVQQYIERAVRYIGRGLEKARLIISMDLYAGPILRGPARIGEVSGVDY